MRAECEFIREKLKKIAAEAAPTGKMAYSHSEKLQ
jgi:hypothetical protein